MQPAMIMTVMTDVVSLTCTWSSHSCQWIVPIHEQFMVFGVCHVTALRFANMLGVQPVMWIGACVVQELHLNRNRYKVCQQEHWKMELHMAGLQNKMEEKSQHSADTCSVTAKCGNLCN